MKLGCFISNLVGDAEQVSLLVAQLVSGLGHRLHARGHVVVPKKDIFNNQFCKKIISQKAHKKVQLMVIFV